MPIVQRSLVLFPSCFLEFVSQIFSLLILVNMLSFVDDMVSVTATQLSVFVAQKQPWTIE